MEQCFRCDRDADQECPRCGALYCDAHGDALCERCQDPALALPSYRIYRGSLLALLAGTVFAVWLLIRPPETTDADSAVPPPLAGVLVAPSATPAATATVTPTATPTPTPSPSPTPAPTATPTPTATPEPAIRVHVVTAGETLFAIAAIYLPQGKQLAGYMDELAAFNDLSDPSSIVVGQEIRIPPQ